MDVSVKPAVTDWHFCILHFDIFVLHFYTFVHFVQFVQFVLFFLHVCTCLYMFVHVCTGCHHHSVPPGQEKWLRYHASDGGATSALCTMDDASCFLVIRLGPKTSECEMNVSVKLAVTD